MRNLGARLSLNLAAGVMSMLVAVAARQAEAADITPPSIMENEGVGSAVQGKPARAGNVSIGVHYTSRTAVGGGIIPAEPGSKDGQPQDSSPQVQQASAVLGLALSRQHVLSLGLHGSQDQLSPSVQEKMALAQDSENPTPATSAQFAGASLLLRLGLAERAGWRVAVAPFAESGAGPSAGTALSREQEGRVGAMGILAYGQRQRFDLSSNLGVRYSEPGTLFGYKYYQDVFAKLAGEIYLAPQFSLYAVSEGRALSRTSLEAASPSSGEEAKASYALGRSAMLGAKISMGDVTMDVQAGSLLGDPAKDLGLGQRMVAMRLAYTVGNYQGNRTAKSGIGKELDRASDESTARKNTQTKSKERRRALHEEVADYFPSNARYDEMNEDPSGSLAGRTVIPGGDDDFTRAERAEAKHRLRDGEVSEDAKVKQELDRLHEAEAAAEAERQEAERLAKEEERRLKREKAESERDELEAQMRAERKKARRLPGITRDEQEWKGLDD